MTLKFGVLSEVGLLALWFLWVGTGSSHGQTNDLGAATRPLDEAPAIPEADLTPPPEPVFELPPVAPAERNRVTGSAAIELRDVVINSNTAIDDATLLALAEPYLGRPVTIEELFQLRDALTLTYVNAGYVNSGAVLPDQEVENGTVQFDIIEGSLEEISINGAVSFDADYLRERIMTGANIPLNVNELQEKLQLIILDPSVKRLDARLGPGSANGKARLDIDLEEDRPFALDVTVSNGQSTSIGANHASAGATVRNMLGRSDRLRFSAGATKGLREVAAEYSVPILASGLTAYFRGNFSASELVTADVEELDIESETASVTAGVILPVVETTTDRIELDLAFVREHNETSLLGEPFSFSPGAEDGETDLSLIRFAQRWQNRGRNRALSLGSTFTFGLDAFGATDNDGNEPDGEFAAWLGQAELAQRLFSDRDQLVVRGELQLTEDPLLASEQFAAGGLDSVRGYRVNEIVRDNGWTASLEYRLPLLDLLYEDRALDDERTLELVPFIDAGGGFKHNGRQNSAQSDTLVAPGLGIRYAEPNWLSTELYWGLPLTGQDGATNDALQEHGVSFRIRMSY